MEESKQASNKSRLKSSQLLNLLKSNAKLLRELRCKEDPQDLLRSYDRETMDRKLNGFLKQDNGIPGMQNGYGRHKSLVEDTFIALNGFLHKSEN